MFRRIYNMQNEEIENMTIAIYQLRFFYFSDSTFKFINSFINASENLFNNNLRKRD